MRKTYIWNDNDAIDHFLQNEEVGHLTTIDPGGWPLTVPVNFIWHGGSIFFHSGSGEKMANLRGNPKVSFIVTEILGLLTSEFTNAPCHDTQLGRSVFFRGLGQEIHDLEIKQRILGKLIAKYDPKAAQRASEDEDFSPESIRELPAFQACRVVEIKVENLCARRCLLLDKPEEYRKAVASHFQKLSHEKGRERDMTTAILLSQSIDIV
ncbi:MAG: pyridoxamine 5'-phosphate oxidase family protein [Candidatus Adiutrix sp.]